MQYKKIRNEIVALTRTKRKPFYKNYFEENNKNLRKVCQCSKQSDIPTREQITNPKDVSNSFNDHYSNINENILKEIKYERHQEGYGDLMTYMPPHKFYCHTFSYWR